MKVRFGVFALFCLGTAGLFAAPTHYETWNEYAVGQSALNGVGNPTEYRLMYTTNVSANNYAVVGVEDDNKFLSICTYGWPENRYVRLVWDPISAANPLSVADAENNHLSVDIRYHSDPSQLNESSTSTSAALFSAKDDQGNISNIWMGFLNTGELFIDLGGGATTRVKFAGTPERPIDLTQWYRLSVTLTPSLGLIEFRAFEVLPNGGTVLIWSGSNLDLGFPAKSIVTLVQAELQVGRPGGNVDRKHISDFDNFRIDSIDPVESSGGTLILISRLIPALESSDVRF